MAYQILSGGVTGMPSADAKIVVWWGARIGGNGSDAISVHPTTGRVTLWDSKAYAADVTIESDTFVLPSPRDKAINAAKRVIESASTTLLTDDLRKKSIVMYEQ